MNRKMVEIFTPTIAFVGGENHRSVVCILPFPRGCTHIHIEDQRLTFAGRWFKGGFDQADTIDQEISTDFHLRPEIMEIIGRPGILITGEGEVFYNYNWLNSVDFSPPLTIGRRRLLRWFTCLPGNLRREHRQFFTGIERTLSLN